MNNDKTHYLITIQRGDQVLTEMVATGDPTKYFVKKVAEAKDRAGYSPRLELGAAALYSATTGSKLPQLVFAILATAEAVAAWKNYNLPIVETNPYD